MREFFSFFLFLFLFHSKSPESYISTDASSKALVKHVTLESLASYSEDLQKLVQFASIFYENPELVTTELCEIIQSCSGAYIQNLHRGVHGSTSAQGAASSTSPATNSYNTRLKSAPKLKPRKGVNITLRGGRLQTVLEEYTDWCRRNKSSWSGNRPNSHVKGWFKIERVRRTFCCCSLVGESQSPPSSLVNAHKLYLWMTCSLLTE